MNCPRLPHLAAPALVALASLPSALPLAPLFPQGDRSIREDLAFARGLASDWQFVEMAEGVLADLDVSRASDRLKEEVALTRCEVYASGARRERDDARREELFDQALTAYRDYLDDNRFAENRGAAERELVNLSSAYGQDLFRLYGEAVGDESERLRDKIESVLDDAIERTADLAEALALEIEDERRQGGSSTALERERYILMLNRGQMYLTLAEVSDDGTYYFEKAAETLEDTATEAGEQSTFGLNAYLMLGQVYTAQSRYQDAVDFISYVVDSAIPTDAQRRTELFDPQPQAAKEAAWHFVDMATGPLMEAFLGLGDFEAATLYGLHFQNCIDVYGFQVSRPRGYQSMLAVARGLIDAGGFVGGSPGEYEWYETRETMEEAHSGRRNRQSALDLALKLAQQVNRDNRGNTLQLAAQKVISSVISRGVAVDPEVLFEAAQGSYYEGDYTRAIEGFKRVLAVLETGDDATRRRLGPEVLWHIGRSFQKSGRLLEAAMAFRTGLDERWKGDPKFDSENANRFHESVRAIKGRTGDDPLIEALFRESQDAVIANQTDAKDAGDILYSQAELAYSQKDYEEARAKFLSVPGSASDHEKALVYAAVCVKKLGDTEQALAELEEYLNVYVKDPVKQPTTENGKIKRQEAKGLATYWMGLIHFERAEGGAGDYGPVVTWLESYPDDFPDQQSFGARTSLMVLNAFLKQGELEKAETRLARMQRDYPTDLSTGIGAYGVYRTYADMRESALQQDEDADVATLTRKMAENLAVYNELSTKPKLNNFRLEANLWLELGDWEEAERVLTRGVNEFPKDADLPTAVIPDLAHAKLKQRKVRETAELLAPLVEDESYKPSKQTALDYALAMTGWIEGARDELVEVPGIGEASELEAAAKILNQIENATETWTCEWYQRKFDAIHAYYRWGQLDGNKLKTAEDMLSRLQSDLSAGMAEIGTACGDDVLRQQFLWLASKL